MSTLSEKLNSESHVILFNGITRYREILGRQCPCSATPTVVSGDVTSLVAPVMLPDNRNGLPRYCLIKGARDLKDYINK